MRRFALGILCCFAAGCLRVEPLPQLPVEWVVEVGGDSVVSESNLCVAVGLPEDARGRLRVEIYAQGAGGVLPFSESREIDLSVETWPEGDCASGRPHRRDGRFHIPVWSGLILAGEAPPGYSAGVDLLTSAGRRPGLLR